MTPSATISRRWPPEIPLRNILTTGWARSLSSKASRKRPNFYRRAFAANPGYRLAEERLVALGGAPVSAPIVLKPPPGAAQGGNAPVVLRPPSSRPVAAPAAVLPKTKPASASSAGVGPGLRPALDNVGGDNVGGQEVQLGVWREAAEGWRRAVAASGGALAGYSHHIVAADLPGRGRYYRLRVSTPDGKQFCTALATRGMDCIPARD